MVAAAEDLPPDLVQALEDSAESLVDGVIERSIEVLNQQSIDQIGRPLTEMQRGFIEIGALSGVEELLRTFQRLKLFDPVALARLLLGGNLP